MSTDLTQAPQHTDPALDGDHERFSHIVKGKAKVTESMITGQPVVALCGKVWVPSRDPKRYPLCGTCREEYQRLTGRDPAGMG